MEENKPRIILDTDMETDCDDAGALALLAEYVRAGMADLAGIIASVPSKYAAPSCEAITSFYGIQTEIGAVHLARYSNDERFHNYFAHRDKYYEYCYNETLAKTLNKTDEDYEDSTLVYRRILSRAEDNSICILLIGTLTAFDLLLMSRPDEICDLGGSELVSRKVCKVIAMSNAIYPRALDNFNWDMDREATERVIKTLPLPMYASPDGADIITGYSFSKDLPNNHPVRIAYEKHNAGQNKGRSSWDIIATLYALEPDNKVFEDRALGQIEYDQKANITSWNKKGTKLDHLLRLKKDQ